MSNRIDAEVTIKFIINDVCDDTDLDDNGEGFEDFVQDRIEHEGLWELVENEDCNFEVVEIKKVM